MIFLEHRIVLFFRRGGKFGQQRGLVQNDPGYFYTEASGGEKSIYFLRIKNIYVTIPKWKPTQNLPGYVFTVNLTENILVFFLTAKNIFLNIIFFVRKIK